MANYYKIGDKNGQPIWAEKEAIINNAKQQEEDGIHPSYYGYDRNTKKVVTPAGWLVWFSVYGCGIVFKGENGAYIINSGFPGDFICK